MSKKDPMYEGLAKIDKLLGGVEDPMEIIFDDESHEKKKKKSKKNKDKDIGSSYKESLKELSKKELREKLKRMVDDTSDIDMDSKKEMRKAILRAHKNGKKSKDEKHSTIKPLDDPREKTDDAKDEKPKKKVKIANRPPHYIDEDTGDYIIADVRNAPDMDIYGAMRSIGAIRKEVRKDDGFAEMMDRIHSKLLESEPEPEAIDVEYTVVEDEPAKMLESKEAKSEKKKSK